MKPTAIIILLVCFFAAIAAKPPSKTTTHLKFGGLSTPKDTIPKKKNYFVAMTLDEWQLHIRYLGFIASRLRATDLPSKEVAFMTDSLIIPMQSRWISQLNPQIAADTVKKK
jgi:hypothetical protein